MYILMINEAIKCSSFFFIFLGLFSKWNRKHFLREIWENSKKVWKHLPAARVPTSFLVLQNFLSCFDKNMENVFYFLIICHLIYGMFEQAELRSRKKGICHIWSRGRRFSFFVPGREVRCMEAMKTQAESDRRVEISGSIVKAQCSDNSSRGTVTRYTIYSGNAHAYIHLFLAICVGTKSK